MNLSLQIIELDIKLKKLIFAFIFLAASAPVLAQSLDGAVAYQYSTIDALLSGVYEGDLSVQDLLHHGDFGLGTYNRIDGEMIVIDGVAYKAKADGTVVDAGRTEQTPFAMVTRFVGGPKIVIIHPTSLKALEAVIGQIMTNKNIFYAIRVEGRFATLKTRAMSAQDKPYQPLAEVSKTQSVFSYVNMPAMLVGFYSPAFSQGINVPGFHWHALSIDHQHGGHVLDLMLTSGVIQVMPIAELELQLPTRAVFSNYEQGSKRSVELMTVEGAH